MNEITLHPTGTCFEDCTLFLGQLIAENKKRIFSETLFLVHGICLMEDGREYSHAWLEENDVVHAPGYIEGEYFKSGVAQKGFLTIERDYFYQKYRVQERTRYTPMQAYARAAECGDIPPPWEPRYRRLCRDYKELTDSGSDG